MAERVIEILKNKYLLSFIRYEGLQRIEGLEIPEDALREAIFNSIIHKNYAGVAIQMKIWNDRIELWNDGEFPFGLTAEDLKNGRKSKPRNRNIANAFYKAGFVESWGRGIKKICIEFSQSGLQKMITSGFRIFSSINNFANHLLTFRHHRKLIYYFFRVFSAC